MFANALPDPEYNAEFYQGVTAKRGVAWIIDTVLTVILTAMIVPFTAFTALFFLPLLFLVVNAAYRWVTISNGSATLGMRMTAIEFRRADGQVFDAGTAFIHTLGYLVSAGMVLPQVISVALMMISPRGQGLTDLVLGTVAINRSARY